ncbi:hypothetical protein, variant [Exophiala dermatitidis NIH/UT8656]|uniref:Uncharacterized protein n=1 Tax=Exophiala dermatitidis (strain ATCC 34100 / CBS 525.76 / NIH/UT8656) TaxID=858893 RepID=H6C0W9_EXODN|nr:uncharacterized protein HMPREF1120_05349 [Exophiala dermatitidis NIH/UT8656]XP_009157768.1 hypothetical protein, variant [Exophiala dermatitidis NIH/UT8656]EHY57306.1 hypothetical protein, variant [Exophiala dermatitidis NIH/UT8656]EHY57307.1 hypothetical protein HMPREF1120_05349 [Exophiala dermatitidis NIH/UT8656]
MGALCAGNVAQQLCYWLPWPRSSVHWRNDQDRSNRKHLEHSLMTRLLGYAVGGVDPVLTASFTQRHRPLDTIPVCAPAILSICLRGFESFQPLIPTYLVTVATGLKSQTRSDVCYSGGHR